MARSAQYIDKNGYLLVKGCPVSRPGIFDYSAAQVGETEGENNGDLNRIVKVFRPPAAVQDPDFIESLKNMPMIDDHEFMIGDESVLDAEERGQIASPEEKGIEGVMTDNVYWADPWLRSDLMIYSRRMQKALKSGKVDVSLGYTSQFEYKPGVWEGQPYDYIQTTMRGNHIALVDEGRVPGARVLDGRLVFDSLSFDVPSTPTNNPEKSTMDEEMMARLKALLPTLEKLCGGSADPAADPAAAEAVVVDPASVTDESQLTENEHQREAGAEEGVAEVLARLEKMVGSLKEGAGEKAESAVAKTADSESQLVTDNEDTDPEKTGDGVEGLVQENPDPKLTVDNAEVPAASPGPKKGENTDKPTADSAFRRVMDMAADRDQLARRVSKHVGTFDHARMTPMEVSDYGCGKLGIKARGAAGRLTLDGYLMGAEKSAKSTAAVKVGDSANTVSDSMSAYLNK